MSGSKNWVMMLWSSQHSDACIMACGCLNLCKRATQFLARGLLLPTFADVYLCLWSLSNSWRRIWRRRRSATTLGHFQISPMHNTWLRSYVCLSFSNYSCRHDMTPKSMHTQKTSFQTQSQNGLQSHRNNDVLPTFHKVDVELNMPAVERPFTLHFVPHQIELDRGPRRPWTTGWWWRDTQISRKKLTVRFPGVKSPLYLIESVRRSIASCALGVGMSAFCLKKKSK